MDNPKLPHLRTPPEEDEPFENMDREMAKHFKHTHPHYNENDWYGNKAPETDDDKDDADAS